MDTTNESASRNEDDGLQSTDTNTNESASRNEDVQSTDTNTIEPASRNENVDDLYHPFECFICYHPAREPVLTKCGHLFCWPCLYTWARTAGTCPVCRAKINQLNIICIQTPWNSDEDFLAKVDENSGIPPRPKSSPPPFRKVVDPVLKAMSRDNAQENECQDSNHVEELATNPLNRWQLIEDLVCSMQFQYEMTQPREQKINAFPPLLDARINYDFRKFEAGRSVPDAQRPHLIMIKERVEAILRRHDHEREAISKNFDIAHREHEQIAESHAQVEEATRSQQEQIAQRHAQEDEIASSHRQENAQRHGREEVEGAGYQQEETTFRREEEEIEVLKIEQHLARIKSALEAAGMEFQLDFAAIEREQIAQTSEDH